MTHIRSTAILALAAAACLAAPRAFCAPPSADPVQGTVSENRLLPRGEIIPKETRDAALAQTTDSGSYYVPLSRWSEKPSGGETAYSSRFKVPYKWNDRAVLLRVNGADAPFRLYVNGKEAGYSTAGTPRSEFDVTPLVNEDYNTAEIRFLSGTQANRLISSRTAGKPSFSSAAVVSQPAVRIDEVLATGRIEDGRGLFSLKVVMQSRLLNSKNFTVRYELLSPAGEVLATGRKGVQTGMRSRDTVSFSAVITDPLPWNHETPYLYTVLVSTVYESRIKEWVRADFGFRTVGHAGGSLLVDSVPVRLYGAETVSSGNADKDYARIMQLKAQGVNYLLVKDRPQPDALYTAADRAGAYVCNQADINTSSGPSRITKGGNISNDPAWEAAFAERAADAYYSFRTHPSSAALSLARHSRNGYCLYETYLLMKSLEPYMAIIYPEAGGEWNTDTLRYKAPAGYIEPVSADLSRIASERLLLLRNNLALTPIKGTMTYRFRNGRREVLKETVPVFIPAGGTQSVSLPASAVEGDRRSVEVTIARQKPIYRHTVAPAELPKPTRRERRALRRGDLAPGMETVAVIKETF